MTSEKNSKTNNKGVVLAFDLDGTLIPTTESEINRFFNLFKKIGLPVKRDDLRKHWGKPLLELAETIVNSLRGNDIHVKKFIELAHEQIAPIQYNQEIPLMLDSIRHKYHLALLTSRSRRSLAQISSDSGFPPLILFPFIQALEDCRFHKPDPRVFGPLIKWGKRRRAQNIIYFGDTVKYDFAAARHHSNITFVGVVSGASKPSDFLAYGVSELVYGVNDLPRYIEERLK